MEQSGFTKKELFLIKCLFVAGATLFVIILVTIIWGHFSMNESIRADEENRIKMRQNRRAEAVGTITRYSESSGSKTGTNRRIEFQFVVDGMRYTDSQYNDSYARVDYYPEGMEGKVCYDPSNPENAEFHSKTGKQVCGE